jgi:HEAT repeat protein
MNRSTLKWLLLLPGTLALLWLGIRIVRTPPAPLPTPAFESTSIHLPAASAPALDRITAADRIAERKSNTPKTIAYLRVCLKATEPEVRAAALRALGALADPATVETILNHFNDPSSSVRAAAVLAAGNIPNERVAAWLGDVIHKDDDPDVRAAAVAALRTAPPDVAGSLLANAMNDKHAIVRRAAVQVLSTLPAETAVNGITKGLVDADPEIRAQSATVVRQFGDTIIHPLRHALSSNPSPEARANAARLLAAIGDAATAPALLALLESPARRSSKFDLTGSTLQTTVVDSLVALGEAVLPVLIRETIDGEYGRAAEQAAAEACRRIGPAASPLITAALLKWKTFPDPDELMMWITVLGDIGHESAWPALQRALDQNIPGMADLVSVAAAKIEKASGKKFTPTSSTVNHPGTLALRQGAPAFTPTTFGDKIPDNGVVRLLLPGAIHSPDVKEALDLELELIRREGKWEPVAFGSQARFNKRDHDGRVRGHRTEAGKVILNLEMFYFDDRYRKGGYGEYEITLEDGLRGTYNGHCNFSVCSGTVTGRSWDRTWSKPSLPELTAGMHPRLLFRQEDIPPLQARAQTPFGQEIINAIRARLASNKHLHAEKVDWVRTWEPGVDLAIAHGLFAVLHDDPLHGRRAAALVLDRTRTPPYPGEHGERLPGPLYQYPLAFDLAYRYFTQEERAEVLEVRGNMHSYTQPEWGPGGVFGAGRGLVSVPGQVALALLGEKGSFKWKEPEPPPPVLVLDPISNVPGNVPVNHFLPGEMIEHWLVSTNKMFNPQDCRPLPAAAVRTVPPPLKEGRYIQVPGVESGTRVFLHSLVKTDREEGSMIERSFTFGDRWRDVWINGQLITNGTVAIMRPGFHHVTIEASGSTASPYFSVVDASFIRALGKRHEYLHTNWEAARQRHAATGIMQDPPLFLDMCQRSTRTGMWEELEKARTGLTARPGTLALAFAATSWHATGEGFFPDIPWSLLHRPEDIRALDNRSLCFALGIAPEPLRRMLAAEFRQRFPAEKLATLPCLDLVAVLAHGPME